MDIAPAADAGSPRFGPALAYLLGAPDIPGFASRAASYLESQARVIASDSIKTRVIEKLGLDKDPDYGGPARGGLFSGLFGADKAATDRKALLYALAALDRSVTVRRGERTFVIDISATASDPEKAAQVANALAESYLEDQAAVRADAAQRATAALTGRLEELRSRVQPA